MRKYRIITDLNPYPSYNDKDDKVYMIQYYRGGILGYFGIWWDFRYYKTLEEAKDRVAFLSENDIYP